MVSVWIRTMECIVLDLENIEDEIMSHCSPNGKDTPQTDEEDAENAFLEDNSQELPVKEAIGKPLTVASLHQ